MGRPLRLRAGQPEPAPAARSTRLRAVPSADREKQLGFGRVHTVTMTTALQPETATGRTAARIHVPQFRLLELPVHPSGTLFAGGGMAGVPWCREIPERDY